MKTNINNLNPELKAVQETYKRIKILIEEDESKYDCSDFFLVLPNEDPTKVAKRKKHFKLGFINESQKLIHCSGDYIYKQEIKRPVKDERLKLFIEKADKTQNLTEFMQEQVSPSLKAYGTVFIVVDKPKGAKKNLKEELESGMPYLRALDPLCVIDYEWAEDGSLLWFRYSIVNELDRTDPFNFVKNGKEDELIVTWTKTEYILSDKKGNRIEDQCFEHGFGLVPVKIQATNVINSNRTIGKSNFENTSKYIIMANNLLSASNNELLRLSSGLLVMNRNDEQTVRDEDEKDDDELLKITRAFSEDGNVWGIGDMAQKPFYLTNDPQIPGLVYDRAVHYFDKAVDNEKSTKSIETAKVPQSGIAKAYDFADQDSTVARDARALENAENGIFEIVTSILKINEVVNVEYPKDFDIKDFNDKVEFIKSLQDINYPSKTAMIEAEKALIPEITTDENIKNEIVKELETVEEISSPDIQPDINNEVSPNQATTDSNVNESDPVNN